MLHTLGHIILCRTFIVALLAGCSLKIATRPHPYHAACNVCGGGSGPPQWRQARQVLARVHRTIANRRTAWHWNTARDLCTRYDTIYLEDLDLRGMKTLWGRKVSDLGFASFVSILHHTAQKMRTHVHHIDRFFPSTTLCHVCGTITMFVTLRDRLWTCPCGARHHQDRNAAITIHQEGLRPAPTQSRQGASSCRQGHCKTSPEAVPA